MESVLVGVDHSESSRRALRFALERARVNSWHVSVVHVINWSPYTAATLEENDYRPQRRIREAARARAKVLDPLMRWAEEQDLTEGIDIDVDVVHGRPSEVLTDLAERDGDDIIVVGRIGESNLRTAIFGSTASRLVQHAPVAVVVVP